MKGKPHTLLQELDNKLAPGLTRASVTNADVIAETTQNSIHNCY